MSVWDNHQWVWSAFLLSGLGFAITRMLLPLACHLFYRANWTCENWQKKQIPSGTGLVCAVSFLLLGLVLLTMKTYFPFIQVQDWQALLIWSAGMTLFGWLDDRWGSREVGGFLGHFRKLAREGELTTGVLKAVGGLVLSLGVAMLLDGMGTAFLVDGLTLAFMANGVNLLDVRSGRAIKGVLLIGIPLLCIGQIDRIFLPLQLFLGVLLAFFPTDLAGKAMLGDTGANFLGAVLGFLVIRSLELPATVMLLVGLILFHLYTEKHSLSQVIENHRILRWLDDWGRPRREDGQDQQAA